jgi:AP-3 complex subunit mu
MVGRIANFVTGKASNLGESLGESAMSVIPWRKSGVKYTQNEVFFDINEELDVIFDANGAAVTSAARGTVVCQSRLSGTPDLTLLLVNPGAVIEDCSFHPCVRYARWEREQCVSFVPPDGQFTLMQYRVAPERATGQCPVFVRPSITWREGGSARASFVLGLKPFAATGSSGSTFGNGSGGISSSPASGGGFNSINSSRPMSGMFNSSSGGASATLMGAGELGVEEVQLVVFFPKVVKTVDLTADAGNVSVDPKTNTITWTLGRFPREKSPELSGTIYLAQGQPSPPVESPHAVLRFALPNQTASGLQVRDLLLSNEKYKFFKGVKNSLRSGRVQIRT